MSWSGISYYNPNDYASLELARWLQLPITVTDDERGEYMRTYFMFFSVYTALGYIAAMHLIFN